MQAKKCDRCGKFYTENENKYIRCCNSVDRVSVCASGNVYDTYDLCDDCVNQLMEFLNEGGDNNA